MKFKKFGDSSLPVVILLHGGGLSWWSFIPIIDILKKKYYIITPVIDGHGEDGGTTFISIAESAKKLLDFIDKQLQGKVYAICGLSLGAQIVIEILSKRSDFCRFAVIESALVFPLKCVNWFIVPSIYLTYPLIKQKWFSKLQAKSLFIPEDKFDYYYKDSCRMTKASLINLVKNNGSYNLNLKLCENKAEGLILVGENELRIMKKSAQTINRVMRYSKLKIIPKSGHGEISLAKPEEYCDLLVELFQ